MPIKYVEFSINKDFKATKLPIPEVFLFSLSITFLTLLKNILILFKFILLLQKQKYETTYSLSELRSYA